MALFTTGPAGCDISIYQIPAPHPSLNMCPSPQPNHGKQAVFTVSQQCAAILSDFWDARLYSCVDKTTVAMPSSRWITSYLCFCVRYLTPPPTTLSLSSVQYWRHRPCSLCSTSQWCLRAALHRCQAFCVSISNSAVITTAYVTLVIVYRYLPWLGATETETNRRRQGLDKQRTVAECSRLARDMQQWRTFVRELVSEPQQQKQSTTTGTTTEWRKSWRSALGQQNTSVIPLSDHRAPGYSIFHLPC